MGEFRTAIRIDPHLVVAHMNLGAALYHQGKLDEAGAEYREVLRIEPKNLAAHLNLVDVLGRQGDRAGALSELREFLRLAPNSGVAEAEIERVRRTLAKLEKR